MTPDELADVLTLYALETFNLIFEDSTKTCEKLEDLASRMLDAQGHLVDGPQRETFAALAKRLIQIEV